MSRSESASDDVVRRLLAGHLGAEARSDGSNVTIVAEQEAVTIDGQVAHRVYGGIEGLHNSSASVVIAEDGTEIGPARLDVPEGWASLAPAGGDDVAIRGERTPVTIDPEVNDLVLSRCSHLDETITVTVPRSGVTPKADVYLLADTTGSMGSVLDAVKAGAAAIVGNPALTGFDVAYGVGNYRDFPIEPGKNSYAFAHQQAPTTTLLDVQNALNTWTAAEGSDGSEGQLWAFEQVSLDPAIGWRPDARRIVVWFGDAPGHDPICAAISGAAADVTEATATAALQAASITVVGVSTTTSVELFPAGTDDDPAKSADDYGVCTVGGSPGQATRITGATGGSLTSGIDASTIVTTLVDLIEAAVTATGNVSLVPTGSITQFVTAISPSGGYGPLAGDTEHVLSFDVDWDGTVRCAEAPQVFTGTLDVVADGLVVASKQVTITVPACRRHYVVDMLCGTQPRPGGGHETGHADEEGPAGGHGDGDEKCTTVVPGVYATAVTIYNPGTCPVTIEKRFAPLLLNGKPVGREPKTVPARRFAKIVLQPNEATMDDCCSLEEIIKPDHATATLGVLDIVSDGDLVVTGVYTSTGQAAAAGAVVHTRTITPHRA